MAYAQPTEATSFELNDNYDFELDEFGRLGMKSGIESISEMVRFDLEELENWVLRETLGMNWIDDNGTGLLQQKDNERLIVNAVQRKVSSRNDIVGINSLVYTTNAKNRTIQIKLVVTTSDLSIEELIVNV